MKRLLMIATLMVFLAVGVASAQPTLQLIWSQQCDGETRVRGTTVECWQESLPPEPTATPQPGATETPTPEPTVTPTPEPGVPMCVHDPLVWHDLFDEQLGCRYDHEHGDNPNLGNAVFGFPGAWYGAPGTEIGGPFAPAHEMAGGHRFWKSYVHLNLPPNRTEAGPPGFYVRDVRAFTHVATGDVGIKHRGHAVSVEMNICTIPADSRTPETCGIARYAGVGDYGNLRFNDQPSGLVLLPLEGDGQDVDLGLMGRRNHPTLEQIGGNQWPGVTWYQRTWCASDELQNLACFSSAAVIDDPWDYIEPIPDDVVLHRIDAPGFNGSSREFHIAASEVNAWAFPSGGAVSFQWVGNSDGTFNPACALGQQGCGYVVLEGVPTVGYIRYANHGTIVTEYDTSPNGDWITFPN